MSSVKLIINFWSRKGVDMRLFLLFVIVAQGFGADWFNMNPDPHPSARQDGHLAYDAESGVVILFGGHPDGRECWAYDLSNNSWRRMSDAPVSMAFHALAYDSAYDRVIAFYGGRTLVYDYNNDFWEDMNPNPAPKAKWGAMLAYDIESGKLILYGGGDVSGGQYFSYDDTWYYDYGTNTWTLLDTAGPPCREYAAMAYDAESDLIILFGGEYNGNQGFLDDTWVYDYNSNTWIEMNPAQSPTERRLHGMVYDASRDRVVLYGGQGGSWDTWEYDYNSDTWEEIVTNNHPNARSNVGMAYHRGENRVVLFGGQYYATYYDETWIYPDPLGISHFRTDRTRMIRVSPNPFRKQIRIYGSGGKRIAVFDVQGRPIAQISGSTWSGNDISGIEVGPGIYFLMIEGLQPVKVVKIR